MINYKKRSIYVIICCIIMVFSFLCCDNEYSKEYPVTCKILKKESTGAGYKVSPSFYFILSDAKGRIFDVDVSRTTYYLSEEGQYKIFLLSEGQIKRNSKIENMNILYGSVFILSFIICLTIIVITAIESELD